MKRFCDKLMHWMQRVAGLLFLLLFLLYGLKIVLRYFLGVSWLWVPDFSRLIFIWIVFLGASVLLGRNDHLLMDFFIARLKPRNRLLTEMFIKGFECVLFLIMVVVGTRMTDVRMGVPFDTWDFPTGYAYLAVPVAGALMLLFSIYRIYDSFLLWRDKK